MIPLLLKSSLGALAVLLIALLSQSRHAMMAGLVPLFPTFALIAHAIVGRERGPALLQGTALFGLAAWRPCSPTPSIYWRSGICRCALASPLPCSVPL